MAEEKQAWYLSKTLWGIVIGSIVTVYSTLQVALGVFGVHMPALPAGLSDALVNGILSVIGLIGTVIAVIGRFNPAIKPLE